MTRKDDIFLGLIALLFVVGGPLAILVNDRYVKANAVEKVEQREINPLVLTKSSNALILTRPTNASVTFGNCSEKCVKILLDTGNVEIVGHDDMESASRQFWKTLQDTFGGVCVQ